MYYIYILCGLYSCLQNNTTRFSAEHLSLCGQEDSHKGRTVCIALLGKQEKSEALCHVEHTEHALRHDELAEVNINKHKAQTRTATWEM